MNFFLECWTYYSDLEKKNKYDKTFIQFAGSRNLLITKPEIFMDSNMKLNEIGSKY